MQQVVESARTSLQTFPWWCSCGEGARGTGVKSHEVVSSLSDSRSNDVRLVIDWDVNS